MPRTAAVFHNDFVFLAHRMLTFGLEYRAEIDFNNPKPKKKRVFL